MTIWQLYCDNDICGQVEDRRRQERENAAGLREAWTGNGGRPPMDSQVRGDLGISVLGDGGVLRGGVKL